MKISRQMVILSSRPFIASATNNIRRRIIFRRSKCFFNWSTLSLCWSSRRRLSVDLFDSGETRSVLFSDDVPRNCRRLAESRHSRPMEVSTSGCCERSSSCGVTKELSLEDDLASGSERKQVVGGSTRNRLSGDTKTESFLDGTDVTVTSFVESCHAHDRIW